ncbi:MAG: proton-conducting transporter membrane subunit [Lacipirellulaceae bacterium]
MHEFLALLISLTALCLIGFAGVPNSVANRSSGRFRQLVTWIAALQAVAAGLICVGLATGFTSTISAEFLCIGESGLATLSVYYDGVASLMLSLVAFIGWIICKYSIRYLDGEANQGRYFRWASFTIGAVSLMVVSGNLLLFFACWVMTSLGLHQLLMHYGERPAARRAAWSKFTVSRLGDVALLGGFTILYSQFGTLNFSELFAAIQQQSVPPSDASTWASFLLIVGAITKSAQVPFHTWLPQTMETPTPVSALMHAGIVNAGGYLIIRTSPIVSLAPTALVILAIFGAVTACYAAVVMLTQTSVKKSLAYSTVAQMGFMMLQCGLGAFSAAMLHIIAHSLYKAHAFLTSGSVLSQQAATLGAKVNSKKPSWFKVAGIGLATLLILDISLAIFAVDPIAKPGGLLLGGVLCLAMTSWLSQVMRAENSRLLYYAMGVTVSLCLAYAASYSVVDSIVAESLPSTALLASGWFLPAMILTGFAGLFLLQASVSSIAQSKRWRAFYVHASNGFYLESLLRRLATQ